jgi:dinuclear metal center YbgI/SA1388 family protein
MIKRNEIVYYLEDYLGVKDIEDYGPQGLQVEGKEDIGKIVTGVSANLELFENAINLGADMIIVHHGLIWYGDDPVIKSDYRRRLKSLLDHDINLLAYHLCLDKHPDVGNNAVAARLFGLTEFEEFAQVGVFGQINPINFDEFLNKVNKIYSEQSLVFNYGPDKVSKIGICSGGGASHISNAIELGMDVYITGEAKEPTLHLAKEGGIHFIAAGHYNTEILGIQVLGEHLEKIFPIETSFVKLSNPV